ncbi:GNAT family N-acetyltransferase [Nocardioides litoris]|uniref:GNAT family N-acetyltransferase n=1 Tax=Nocardioides litoris TaxID=1926648 RepID=UPI001B86D8DB|nr:GNAT family N-acetyltransferase [Nocardioides litoris]
MLVAEVDGTPVGFLRWGALRDEVPFMHLLWVLPTARGRGAGRALVEAWEHAHRTQRFVLTSTSAAEQAQHLHRHLGYVDAGSLLLPGEPAELPLRKDLGA